MIVELSNLADIFENVKVTFSCRKMEIEMKSK